MRKLLIAISIFHFSIVGHAQTLTVNGYIRSAHNGEALAGAMVSSLSNFAAVITNEYGFYSLNLPLGIHIIEYSFIGYDTYIDTINITANITKSIQLNQGSIAISTVIIRAQEYGNIIGGTRLNQEQIEKTATIFGEPDVIKIMQLQPGVKNIGDGASGMYIRGTNRDQNHILIDEASIYNVSHMFGYVSSINPSMLKDVKFYNSFIPAEYGGRIGAVLDARLREGNTQTYKGEIGLSILTANASIEGPIKKNKSSFFASYRNSTLDMFISNEHLIIPSFYDVTIKCNFSLNHKNHIYFSTYSSGDNIILEEYLNNSKNNSYTVRWNHIITPKLFSNTSIIKSSYNNETNFSDSAFLKIGIEDYSLKSKLIWYIRPFHKFSGGLLLKNNAFTPGKMNTVKTSISNVTMFEDALFVQYDGRLFANWTIIVGLRYHSYRNYGKATWHELNDLYRAVTIHEENKGIWSSYSFLEPRFALSRRKEKHEYSFTYSKTSQASQIISNNAFAFSMTELWMPASKNIKPLEAHNYSLGYSYYAKKMKYSIEGYLKNIYHQIDYIDHAQLFGNPIIEAEIRSGKANSYGIETSIEKNIKNFSGSISYVWSRVLYTIPGISKQETYRAPYDMPHDIKIQARQGIKDRLYCSAIWVYTSGRPVTLPIGYYRKEDGTTTMIYSDRNYYSYKDYHRLDISCNYDFKPQKFIKHSLGFGIYNIYARPNAVYYRFGIEKESVYAPEENPYKQKVYTVSFFRFLPSFTYRATFF